MKRFVLGLVCAVLLGSSQSCYEADGRQKELPIVILHDNDVHCQENGYVRFAGLRDAIRKADTAWVLTVSSGDFIQGGLAGAYSRGGYIIDIMKSVHYDVVTLGNHEFDFGIPRQMELFQSLGGEKVVSANFLHEDTWKPVYHPYIIKECGNRKIAFVGATTPDVMSINQKAFMNEENDGFSYFVPDHETVRLVQEAVDDAREIGADYVILLSHLGELTAETSDIYSISLIENTTGIDAVLDGHTHTLLPERFVRNRDGKEVLLTQTGTGFTHYGKVTISANGTFHAECIPDSLMGDFSSREVADAVDSVHALCNELNRKVIGYSDFALSINDKDGKRLVRNSETNIGDLVCDAMRSMGNACVAFVNGGSLRNDIPAGEISYGDVFNAIPYLNELKDIELSGQQLKEVMESSFSLYPQESGAFLQVSGLKFTYDSDSTPHLCDVMVLSHDSTYIPVSDTDIFNVTTTEYVLGDWANYPTLEGVTPKSSYASAREATVEYIKQIGGTIPEVYRTPQNRIAVK